MIGTFLSVNDFEGKTIIPFCTSSSDDIDNSLHIFSELCPNAEIAEGLTANDLNDIEPWIQSLGLMEYRKFDAEEPQQAGQSNALVAYFTYSENMGDTSGMSVDAITSASVGPTENTEGNLQVMAQVIRENMGADVFHIVVSDPYDPEYNVMLDRAVEEIENNTLPALTDSVENMEQYDVVYLGTPVWGGVLPQPVVTFLTENDLSGKTIIPFGIHLGSQFGRMLNQIEELCPEATLAEGFTISASTSNDDVRTEFGEWLANQEN